MSGSGPNKAVFPGLTLANFRKPTLKPAPVKQQQTAAEAAASAEATQGNPTEASVPAAVLQPSELSQPPNTSGTGAAARKPLQPRCNSKEKQGKATKIQQQKQHQHASIPHSDDLDKDQTNPPHPAVPIAKAPGPEAKAARPQRKLTAKSKEEEPQLVVIEDSNDGVPPVQQQEQHDYDPSYHQESPAEAASLEKTGFHDDNERRNGGNGRQQAPDPEKQQQNKAKRQTFKDGEEIFKHMQGLAEVRQEWAWCQ